MAKKGCTADKIRRVGIMGGTFDPIHIGHLILGENAWHQFKLDTVLFMPSANPPHKRNRTDLADVKERIDMVRLAIQGNPHFELSLAEAYTEDFCYTRETLRRLTALHPDTEYYFIMGADSLFSFESWKEPQEICRLCVLAVATRDHVMESRLQKQISYLAEKYDARIETLTTPNIDISSHDIRAWQKNDSISLRYYVPDPVIAYIREKGLYHEEEKESEEQEMAGECKKQ